MKPTAPTSRRSTTPTSFRVIQPLLEDPRFLTPDPDEERQYLEDMRLCGYGGPFGKRWWER